MSTIADRTLPPHLVYMLECRHLDTSDYHSLHLVERDVVAAVVDLGRAG